MVKKIDGVFDEQVYMMLNPDIALAINSGEFTSARDHYNRAGRLEGRVASVHQFVLHQAQQLSSFKRVSLDLDHRVAAITHELKEREIRVNELTDQLKDKEKRVKALENSFSWRITSPLRQLFSRDTNSGIFTRRIAKIVWWSVTLQLHKRVSNWISIRQVKKIGVPHFSPPVNDYCYAVPFAYPVQKVSDSISVAVICHMYYPEMIEEFKRYLLNIPFSFDLFITTDTQEKKIALFSRFSDWEKGLVEIRQVPNRGRDIAPKLISCRDIYKRYEFFLHIHSKKSPHADFLASWREYLLETLLGSTAIVESIFEAFSLDPLLGIVAPEHYKPVRGSIGWGWNFEFARKFARRVAIELSIDEKIDFPSGSMFWGRSAALLPLLESDLALKDFPPEASQIDGTLGHVIERLYFFICEKAGYRWIKIACPHLLMSNEKMLIIDKMSLLINTIKKTQYNLLSNPKDSIFISENIVLGLDSVQDDATKQLQLAHKQSNLHHLDFSNFRNELTKHLSNKDSLIDFDESFYLTAHADVADAVANGNVSCGYVHFCMSGKHESRIYSDCQLSHKFLIAPNYPKGFFEPYKQSITTNSIIATDLSCSEHATLLILFSHLQEDLFFAGYAEFFKDYQTVFEEFNNVIFCVNNSIFDAKIATSFLPRAKVISLSEIASMNVRPSIIVAFNAHLTQIAHQMLPDNPERVIYYCQDFEAGFFPFGIDYIVCEKAIACSKNIVISTVLLRDFFVRKNLLTNQNVFVTKPKIIIFPVEHTKNKRLFFYYRPESFHKRNLPEVLESIAREFCSKYLGYEIYMVGSVATSYSYSINGNQIYVVSKLSSKDYIALVLSCDVVISMIYSAHPGVIAFQSAASGIPTVTNIFENRDSILLKSISGNIVPYDPISGNLLDAIELALAMPKGFPSFNELLYSGKQQGSLVDFHLNILAVAAQVHAAQSLSMCGVGVSQ